MEAIKEFEGEKILPLHNFMNNFRELNKELNINTI